MSYLINFVTKDFTSNSFPNEDEVIRWITLPGSIEKVKQMFSLYKQGLLINEEFFLSIQDMCIDGKILNKECSTKFENEIFSKNFDKISWKNNCINVIYYIGKTHPKLMKIINEGAEKGSYFFRSGLLSEENKFTTIIKILGLANTRKVKNKNQCDLRDVEWYSGVEIFRESVKKIGTTNLDVSSLDLIGDKDVPNKMVGEVKNQNFSLVSFQNNSNNKTTGDGSPIGNNNKSKKKTTNNNYKNEPKSLINRFFDFIKGLSDTIKAIIFLIGIILILALYGWKKGWFMVINKGIEALTNVPENIITVTIIPTIITKD